VSADRRGSAGAATGRVARVAVSWLPAVARDLSPAAAPAPPAVPSTWARRAVLACALAVLGLGTLDLYQHYRLSLAASVALSLARALPLVVCLSRPLAGWWLVLAASALTALVADPVSSAEPWPWPITSVFALLVVLVVVGLRAPRRVLVELWLLLGLVSTAAWLAVPDRRDWRGLSTMVVVSAIALLLADAWRERSETGRRLTEQEHISQAERGRRVLLEERARIARELHDVVAHHMSVIAIQAEAAPYRVPDPPGELTGSFAAIRASALQALEELRRVLGVLRAEGDGDDGAEVAPQPTLDRLDELVAGVRGAGLAVETAVTGTPRPLPPGVDVSAYRIVQEALSNALRHAPGAEVRVEVAHAPAALRLCVVNGPPRAAAATTPPGPGHGLLGIRERAAMLGGELDAAPTSGGGYAVTAVLPLPPGEGA
jgi:signal transduction histidine kinase